MKKAFLFTIMGITAAVFISCSPLDRRLKDQGEGEKTVTAPTYNMTGAYLAGRVAHIRKDFGKAADYYRVILDSHPDMRLQCMRKKLLIIKKRLYLHI